MKMVGGGWRMADGDTHGVRWVLGLFPPAVKYSWFAVCCRT